MILMVEFINLWNLSNITEGGTYSLMFDFIALGIIAEFDDYFVELYSDTQLSPLIELQVTQTNVKSHKAKRHSTRETSAHMKLKKVR